MKNGVQFVKYSPDKPKKILLIQTKMCYEKIYDSAIRDMDIRQGSVPNTDRLIDEYLKRILFHTS